jgi:hypothetical protein
MNILNSATETDSPHIRERSGAEVYLMNLTEFMKGTSDHLSTLQADFLSEGTRRDQRVLLAVAFVLMLATIGTISVATSQTIEFSGLKLLVDLGGKLVLIGLLVCGFFELTYLMRAFADWTAYSIKQGLASAELEIVRTRLLTAWDGKAPKPFEESVVAGRLRGRAYFEGAERDTAEFLRLKELHNQQVFGLIDKRGWLDSRLRRINASRILRLGLEVLFPLAFGAGAILLAVRRLLA